MSEVILKNVKKVYNGKITAVHDFNLEIKDKEFVVFVGPSGCGKSTTLRMIAGLEEITEGDIYIGNRLVNNMQPKDRDIAMVFQSYALYPHMTVYGNMAFSLKIKRIVKPEGEGRLHTSNKMKDFWYGITYPLTKNWKKRHLTPEEIDIRVQKAAKTLDITEYLDRKPKELSGGQRQRIAIGRAIVRNPKVMLMDEPLSNLDAKLRNQMRAELIALRQKIHSTFIYVTHDQVEAMTLGDRIVIMKNGFIQQVGTPSEVFDTPANLFVAGFIGTPQMNFLDAHLIEKDGSYFAKVGEVIFPITPEGNEILRNNKITNKKIILGVRPEHFSLSCEPGSNYLSGTVEMTEMMGSEIYVHLIGHDKKKVTVRFSLLNINPKVSCHLKRGETLDYTFEGKVMQLFDPETEENLLLGKKQ